MARQIEQDDHCRASPEEQQRLADGLLSQRHSGNIVTISSCAAPGDWIDEGIETADRLPGARTGP